jgi:hypothetical protein
VIARGDLSLRIVELPELRRLILNRDIRIVLPNRKHLGRKLLPEFVAKRKEQTLKILRALDTVAISFDWWP